MTWLCPACSFALSHGMLGLASRHCWRASCRDGGKRHRLQYRLHLRYLPVLHKTESQRPALPRGGAGGDRGRHRAFHHCGIRRQPVNNIMDVLQLVFAFVNAPLFATFLLVCSGSARPAMAHLPTVRRTAAPRCTKVSRFRMEPYQALKGMAGCSPSIPERDGAELLDRHLRLDYVLCSHDSSQPVDKAPDEKGLVGLVYS